MTLTYIEVNSRFSPPETCSSRTETCSSAYVVHTLGPTYAILKADCHGARDTCGYVAYVWRGLRLMCMCAGMCAHRGGLGVTYPTYTQDPRATLEDGLESSHTFGPTYPQRIRNVSPTSSWRDRRKMETT